MGHTPTGRATIVLRQMNSARRLERRGELLRAFVTNRAQAEAQFRYAP